ncbi:hypothetical protein Tco_0422704 [Tanacetum coccineum]
MISNEFAVKLCLEHEVNNRDKVVKKELIVAVRGEIYFVKFVINPEKDDIEPGVVLGRSILRLTKGIADFENGIITIYPDLDPFNDLDGELELEEEEANEEMIREYKAIKEKEDPGVTTVIAKFLILDMSVDHTILIIVGRSFLHTCGGIINTLKGTTSTFDGVCHQKFYVAEIQNKGEESDSDDEEEYYLKRDEIGRPFYVPNLISYFDHNDPMERALAIQDSINPFRKIYVWKKAVAFLGSEVLADEVIEEDEEVDENELDRSGDNNPTRWGKYTDILLEMPRSHSIGYYLKHDINRKTIEDLVDKHEYNDALQKTPLGKIDKKAYESLP